MINRIRVVTLLVMVLGVFALLQLISGSLFFSSLHHSQKSFVVSNQLREQQGELTSTWDLMLQTRINLSRSAVRMMMDSSNQQSNAKVELLDSARKTLAQAATHYKKFKSMAPLPEMVATSRNIDEKYKNYHTALTELIDYLDYGNTGAYFAQPTQGMQNAMGEAFAQYALSSEKLYRDIVTDNADDYRFAQWQLAVIALVVVLILLVALISPVMLGGLVFSGKSLQPKFSKLNPLPGIKRMFSAQTGAELLKAILKTILVGSVTGFFLWHHWPQMMRLMAESPITAMGNAMDLVGLCALLVVLGVIPMVGFDVFFQIFSHPKKLRMSRQDIRDEFKQSEGDPHVKGRIRQMQRAAARRRMMADVPKADVIVNNPTHYSVALQYDENKMSAPKVVAKGAGLVALRIREIGAENNVPTLEAPPLARALYRHAEIGQQIPGQLYAAVAEVLAWVWQLKRWRLAGGQRPVQPTHLPVPEALDFINEKPTHE
ncbi:flagellar type III secretion system protein FlhB [Escherichia coli]|nr:flagellar type III secretion system protein FlhB [Escherichia coli]EJU1403499.1 flagellar type III secretion system protein FlhB [Escherichia coli]